MKEICVGTTPVQQRHTNPTHTEIILLRLKLHFQCFFPGRGLQAGHLRKWRKAVFLALPLKELVCVLPCLRELWRSGDTPDGDTAGGDVASLPGQGSSWTAEGAAELQTLHSWAPLF